MANSKVHTSKARMGMANIFGNEIIPVPEPDIETFRISLFGAPSVGKSSLICQLAFGAFDDCYDPTSEDKYSIRTEVHNKPCILEFLDSNREMGFAAKWELRMRESDATMLVYSVSSRKSFELITELWKEIKTLKTQMGLWEPFQICLVGNKIDLEHPRVVSTEEGRALAAKLGCGFEECSTRTSFNVEKAPYDLVRKIKTYRDNQRIRFIELQKQTLKDKERRLERKAKWRNVFSLSRTSHLFK